MNICKYTYKKSREDTLSLATMKNLCMMVARRIIERGSLWAFGHRVLIKNDYVRVMHPVNGFTSN